MAEPVRKQKKKTVRRRRPGLLSIVAVLAMFVCLGLFVLALVQIDLLPSHILLTGVVILAVSLLIYVILWFKFARKTAARVICWLVAVALACGFFVGADYLKKTDEVFDNVTNLTDRIANTVSLVGLKKDNIDNVSDLNGKTVGTVPEADPEGIAKGLQELQSKASVSVQDYPDVISCVQALYDGEVQAVLIPDNTRQIIHETEGFFEFQTDSNVLQQTVWYTDRTKSAANDPDSVADITRDPFTVLISGNDSYGSLNENSRSDVNMLLTIDPRTQVVLITSIPRDAYLTMSCKKDETACSPVDDKLTHTGLYGVGTTESTIEDYLGIEINYTVRVNFSSLVNLVDAMGGIDVEIPEGLEVDTFYANGTEGVKAGWNHLEGERALAFARERHAYQDGDNQRIRNQQQVMRALIDKIISPELLFRYPALMDAVSVAFETNMPADQIKSFLRYELLRRPNWQIISYAIAGDPDTQLSGTIGSYVAVTIPRPEMTDAARTLILMTENGDSADEVRSYAEAHSVDAAGSLSVDQQRAERAAGMGEVYVPEEDAGYAPVYGTEDDTSEDDVLYEDAGTVPQGNDFSDPEDDAGSFEYTYE
ncbi:LCP family protein [Faecalibaculum rodentium]|jgi:LCP family protein required for cell wall assembly|uniref:LCP family glycopolymer transferase n=4 Tax=Faecalibaculum rodentium TaxID=1702221 RepID=UPI002493098B|nr:LCP family protein [Faecalibaculum rodentium]